jgi:hypothetical protein
MWYNDPMNKVIIPLIVLTTLVIPTLAPAEDSVFAASSQITLTIPDRGLELQFVGLSDDQAIRANGDTPVVVSVIAVDPYVLLVDDEVVTEAPAGTHQHLLYGVPRGTHTFTIRSADAEVTVTAHVLKAFAR